MTNLSSLTRFSKAKIEQIAFDQVRPKSIHKEKMHIVVASMRLDCIISEILRTSRGKTEEIEQIEGTTKNDRIKLVVGKFV